MAVSLNPFLAFNSKAVNHENSLKSYKVFFTPKPQRLCLSSLLNADQLASSESNSDESTTEASDSTQSTPKKVPLTARDRLKAARVLSSRVSYTKPSEMGRKVLDALKESDKGKKRSRLPEAPTNMMDDSKRGMPKAGLTFQFPGGNDLFIIVFSFVFISTVMFATTFLVWKLGAIHYNEL